MSSESNSPTTIDVTNGHTETPSATDSTHTTTTHRDDEPVDEELGELAVECQAVLNDLDENPVALRVETTVLGITLFYTDFAIADNGTYISRIGHPKLGVSDWIRERTHQSGLYREKIINHVESVESCTFIELTNDVEPDT